MKQASGEMLGTSRKGGRVQRQLSSLPMAVPVRFGSRKSRAGGVSAWHSFSPVKETYSVLKNTSCHLQNQN